MTPEEALNKLEARKDVITGKAIPKAAGARCRRCLKVIREDGHDSYCSSDCWAAENHELSQSALRAAVLERDKGVCHDCGCDCEALREELRMLREDYPCSMRAPMVLDARIHQLVRLGFPRGPVERGETLWEADHVKERVKGGPNTLANLATRCLACHSKKTSSLASSRAESRKVGGRTFPKKKLRGRRFGGR